MPLSATFDRRRRSSSARSSSPLRLPTVRPRPRFASIASTAFLTMLVSAWPSWRRSQTSTGDGIGRVEREVDAGMRDLVQEQRLARDVDDGSRRGTPAWACARRRRIRRPSGGDRRPDGRSSRSAARTLPDRSVDFLAVAALEPLGGELDRGERVLDLVRDAPRDVGPGGAALVEQVAAVMSSKVRTWPPSRRDDRHRERPHLPAAGELDDRLADSLADRADRVPARPRRAAGRSGFSPCVCSRRSADWLISRIAPLAVDRDDARADARQHRLDQRAALFELAVGRDERAGLLLEPPVMRLKAVASVPTSSRRVAGAARARTGRRSVTRRAAPTSSAIGRISRSATVNAIQIADRDDQQRDHQQARR